MAGAGMTFDELFAQVGERLTQIQQWQRDLEGLREAATDESGSVEAEVDAYGTPSKLWLDPAALRLRPAELGRLIVETFDAAASALDARRGQIDHELSAETADWTAR